MNILSENKNIEKALKMSSINSAGVVSEFGATRGLLTFDEIEKRLSNSPDYVCKIEAE